MTLDTHGNRPESPVAYSCGPENAGDAEAAQLLTRFNRMLDEQAGREAERIEEYRLGQAREMCAREGHTFTVVSTSGGGWCIHCGDVAPPDQVRSEARTAAALCFANAAAGRTEAECGCRETPGFAAGYIHHATLLPAQPERPRADWDRGEDPLPCGKKIRAIGLLFGAGLLVGAVSGFLGAVVWFA